VPDAGYLPDKVVLTEVPYKQWPSS